MMAMMTMTSLDENHLPMLTSTGNPVRQDIKVQGQKSVFFFPEDKCQICIVFSLENISVTWHIY